MGDAEGGAPAPFAKAITSGVTAQLKSILKILRAFICADIFIKLVCIHEQT